MMTSIKRIWIFFGMTLLILAFLTAYTQQGEQIDNDFTTLKGPYLGQRPPGMTPEIFAPGIISTAQKYELNSVFSPEAAISTGQMLELSIN